MDIPNAERASDPTEAEIQQLLSLQHMDMEQGVVSYSANAEERRRYRAKLRSRDIIRNNHRLLTASHNDDYQKRSDAMFGSSPAVEAPPAAARPTLVPPLTPGQRMATDQLHHVAKQRGTTLEDAGHDVRVSIFTEVRAKNPGLKAEYDDLEPRYLARAEAAPEPPIIVLSVADTAASNPGPPAASQPTPPPAAGPEPAAPATEDWGEAARKKRSSWMAEVCERRKVARLDDLSVEDLKAEVEGAPADVRQWIADQAKKMETSPPPSPEVKKVCPVCKRSVPTHLVEGRAYFKSHGLGAHQCPGQGKEAVDPVDAEAERERTRRKARKIVDADDQQARQLVVTLASEYKPRAVEWLWKDRIPLGMLSLLGGREGTGKSTLIYERAARITRGDLDGPVKPRNVIVVATEDSWAHTITPRLMAAGADLDRVMRVTAEVKDLGTFELSLPDDIPELQRLIAKSGVALVILDPVISRLSRRIDTHKDSEVKLGLEPLAKLADEARIAVVGLIHVNKGDSKDPLTMIMGSRAFVATARAVLFVNRDPEGGSKRILGQPKNNVGPDDDSGLPSLTFNIEPVTLEDCKDEVTGEPIKTTRVVWTGTTTRTTRDVVAQAAKGVTKLSRATDWLARFLGTKTVPVAEVIKAGIEAGFDADGRTLRDAAQELGVIREKSGFPATGTWRTEL
jgi:hypothetical protein